MERPIEEVLLKHDLGAKKYGVFLSYHGKDVGNGFVNNLYDDLTRAGISTFFKEKIGPSDSIEEQTLSAIHNSKIYMPVFSKTYADSRSTLEQHEKIMEICKVYTRPLIPIYLDGLERSDVGEQTGTLGDAFAKHEEYYRGTMNTVKRWRRALEKTADLGGMFLKDRKESEFIQEIVQVVKDELNRTLPVVDHSCSGNTSWFSKLISSIKGGDRQVKDMEVHI